MDWMSPRETRQYYLDRVIADPRQAEKQLYRAVIKREVRARLNGRLLGPEWLKQLERLTVDPDRPFALPPDIELSVEDVKRKWLIG